MRKPPNLLPRARHRESIDPDQFLTTQQWSKTTSGQPVLTLEKSLVNISGSTFMDDTVTPLFKQIQQSGGFVNTSMGKRVKALVAGGGSYSARNNSTGDMNYTTGAGSITLFSLSQVSPVFASPAHPSRDLLGVAKLAALAKIDKTPYSLMEDALSIRQTLGTLRNPVQSLANLTKNLERNLKKLRKMRAKAAKLGQKASKVAEARTATANADKAIAQCYLEYRMAVSPLVRSMHDVVDGLMTGKSPRPVRRRSRGSDSYSSKVYENVNYYFTPSVYNTYFHKANASWEYKAGILYEVSNPVADWKTEFGLRGKDLPVGLWNIIPISFMVDRLVDISSAIKGLMNLADPNVRILAAWYTMAYDFSDTKSFIWQVNPGWSITVAGDSPTTTEKLKIRVPWTPDVTDLIPPSTPEKLLGTDVYKGAGDILNTLDLVSLILGRLK